MFLQEAFSALEVLRSSFVLKTLAEVEESGREAEGRRRLDESFHSCPGVPATNEKSETETEKRFC